MNLVSIPPETSHLLCIQTSKVLCMPACTGMYVGILDNLWDLDCAFHYHRVKVVSDIIWRGWVSIWKQYI